MSEKLISYARLVAIAASQNQLDEEVALVFCRDAVPQILAELEVLSRVNQRFEIALGLPMQDAAPEQPEVKVCEATICSDRWHKPVAKKAAKKTRKKKARAK